MPTAANPLSLGLVPGDPSKRVASSGVNPFLPSPGTSTGTRRAAENLGFGANAGPFTSSASLAGPSSKGPYDFLGTMSNRDWKDLYKNLSSTFGQGYAQMLIRFLAGGAGFNQQALNNLLAALQPGIERGEEDIMEQFSVMGNRFGSPAATGLADYLSRVNLNEGQIVAQMYEDSLNRFVDTLMGTGKLSAQRISESPSLWDQLGGILQMAGGGAGAASAAGVGSGSSLGTILDIIAGLGAAA